MKILVVFHSKTGNTRSFAEKIIMRLRSDGHEVDGHELETVQPLPENASPTSMDFMLKPVPDLDEYDVFLVGSPVWAFRPAPLAVKYLMNSPALRGKRMMPFITKSLPFKFLGGTGSLKKLSDLAISKGARVMEGSIITYMLSKPDELMAAEVQRISKLFK